MAGLASRNIWAFIVPSVIVIFSLFWFRKKRKIKDHVENSSSSIEGFEVSAVANSNSNDYLSKNCKTPNDSISQLPGVTIVEFPNIEQYAFISPSMDNVIKSNAIVKDKKLELNSDEISCKSSEFVYFDDKGNTLLNFVSKSIIGETSGDSTSNECKKNETYKSDNIFIDFQNANEKTQDLLVRDSKSYKDVTDLVSHDESKHELEVFENDLGISKMDQPPVFVKANASVLHRTGKNDLEKCSKVKVTRDAEFVGFSSSVHCDSIPIKHKWGEKCSSLYRPEFRIADNIPFNCENLEMCSIANVCVEQDENSDSLNESNKYINPHKLKNTSGSEFHNLQSEIYIRKVPNEVLELCTLKETMVESCNPNDQILKSCPLNEVPEPYTPSKEVLEPCTPDEKVLEPCVPGEEVFEPCVPGEEVLEPCVPGEEVLEPCTPEKEVLESYTPDARVTESYTLNARMIESCTRDVRMIKSCILSEGMVESCAPEVEVVESCSLNEGVVESCSLNEGVVESCSLNEGVVESCSLNEGVVESCSLNEGVVESCSRNKGVVESDTPKKRVLESGTPSEGVLESGTPSEGVLESGTPSEGVLESCTPSEGVLESCTPSEGVLESCTPSEGVLESCTPNEGVLASCTPDKKVHIKALESCISNEKVFSKVHGSCTLNKKISSKVIETCVSKETVQNGKVEIFVINGSTRNGTIEVQSSSDDAQSWSDEVQSLSDEMHSSSEDVVTSCDEVPCSNNRFPCVGHVLDKPETTESIVVSKGEKEINVQVNQLYSSQAMSTLEESGILSSPLSTASISDLSPFSPTMTVEEEPMSLISADASSCANDEVDDLRSQDDSINNVNDKSLLNENELLPSQDHLYALPALNEGAASSKTTETLLSSMLEPILTLDMSDGPADVEPEHDMSKHTEIELEHSNEKKRSSPHIIQVSDVPSEGSIDSEKGNGIVPVARAKCPEGLPDYCVYEFELPQELCGRLIGKHGKHVKYIKERSNANVFIKRHPYNPQLKLAVVEGTQSDVNNALELIRKKYPPSQYAHVTLAQTNVLNSLGFHLPESLQLHLPEGVSCNVILSSLVTAGHFFLQQPTHHTYPSLSTLDQCMMACYTQLETPQLPQPVEAGVICAATIMNGWFRAQVVYVYESGEECDVKFVDYGGFTQVSISSLRQIRSDFMSLPFQASECYLANVKPVSEELGWSPAASATFEELAQGQILHALVVDYTDEGNPCVHLYRVQGVSSTFINRELVDRGFAHWVD